MGSNKHVPAGKYCLAWPRKRKNVEEKHIQPLKLAFCYVQENETKNNTLIMIFIFSILLMGANATVVRLLSTAFLVNITVVTLPR